MFGAQPTVQDAKKFLDDAEKKLFDLNLEASQAAWVASTYITDDSEAVEARANERSIAESVRLAKGAVAFDKVKLPPDMARKMMLLKNGLVLAAPSDTPPRVPRSRVSRRRSKECMEKESIARRAATPAWISKPSRA